MPSSAFPVVARLLLPDDANVSGNVHGGTILQLMEQAGMIAATRHVNSSVSGEHSGKQTAGLARIETMAFHQPMFVGEIASVCAQVVFTSDRSVLTKVTVTAENAATANIRVTNTGLLWYLSFVVSKEKRSNDEPDIVAVPQLVPPGDDDAKSSKEYQQYKALYQARKRDAPSDSCPASKNGDIVEKSSDEKVVARTPSESHQRLCQMVLPSDCGISNFCFGGFVMKLMDNAAGCCAFKHCRTNVVTVSISAMDFVGFVGLGDIVTIDASMIFCSAKSMEISVKASVQSAVKEEQLVAQGNFTFVSLDAKNKVIPVPGIRFENDSQREKAFQAEQKYESFKRSKQANTGTR